MCLIKSVIIWRSCAYKLINICMSVFMVIIDIVVVVIVVAATSFAKRLNSAASMAFVPPCLSCVCILIE